MRVQALEVTFAVLKILGPGMHLLEMAKVAWNALIQSESVIEPGFSKEENERDLHKCLASSEAILSVLGPEGDTWNGPLVEIQTLKRMLVDE